MCLINTTHARQKTLSFFVNLSPKMYDTSVAQCIAISIVHSLMWLSFLYKRMYRAWLTVAISFRDNNVSCICTVTLSLSLSVFIPLSPSPSLEWTHLSVRNPCSISREFCMGSYGWKIWVCCREGEREGLGAKRKTRLYEANPDEIIQERKDWTIQTHRLSF